MMKKRSRVILALIVAVVLTATALVIGVAASENSPALEINGANVSFEGTVHLWYSVGYENVENPEDIKLLVWRESSVTNIDGCVLGTQNAMLNSSGDVDEEKITGKAFDYDGLAAAEMTENIYARAYLDVDGEAVYSPVVKYSILQYSLNKLGITGEKTKNSKLYDTLEALLVYGAASQKLFDTNLDRLATDSYVKMQLVDATFADGTNTELVKLGE